MEIYPSADMQRMLADFKMKIFVEAFFIQEYFMLFLTLPSQKGNIFKRMLHLIITSAKKKKKKNFYMCLLNFIFPFL